VIVVEAIRRLLAPPSVDAKLILVIALVGIVVNVAATWVLAKANRQSLNVEGSFQHILTDLAAFIFTAIAAIVILATGFRRADGIAALVVAAGRPPSCRGAGPRRGCPPRDHRRLRADELTGIRN